MKFSKQHVVIALLIALSLTGCIEVEDDSNDGLVEMLSQQNQILSDQNNLLDQQNETEQETHSVTFAGGIAEIISDTGVSGAQI